MSRSDKKNILDNDDFLFRFRSAKALLDAHDDGGFQELERQEIYFSNPKYLNDPMEGIYDAFWNGDQVLWENLFRQYALSLIWYSGGWLVSSPQDARSIEVCASITVDDLPTDEFRSMYSEFCEGFCSEIEVQEVTEWLDLHEFPLRRDRLVILLLAIHHAALLHLFKVLSKNGLCKNIGFPGYRKDFLKTIFRCWDEMSSGKSQGFASIDEHYEVVSGIVIRAYHQLDLGILSRAEDAEWAQKTVALFSRFPELYVDAFLRDLHFTPWRVACFSRKCVNASMWGSYGFEHRGAALIFRTEKEGGKRFFRVKGMAGMGGEGCRLEVRPVIYRNRPPAIDSFLSIGRLSMKKLESTWMTSQSGGISRRLREFTEDETAWHKDYWNTAFERVTWKHPDWEHEDEQRLVVTSVLADDPAPTALKYDFSQLEGIVFGMRMSNEDKLRISRLIERKCREQGRSDFRFFQAHYSSSKGAMDIAELGLLKFE